MKNLFINPAVVSNTDLFSFVEVPSMYPGFYDVIFCNERIAIINGTVAPLQWTKQARNVPVSVLDNLEELVREMVIETAYSAK